MTETIVICVVSIIVFIIIKSIRITRIQDVYLCTSLRKREDTDQFINWKDTIPPVPSVFKDEKGNVIAVKNLYIFWDPKNKKWILVKKYDEEKDIYVKGDIVLMTTCDWSGYFLGKHETNLIIYYETVMHLETTPDLRSNEIEERRRFIELGNLKKDTTIRLIGKIIFMG